MEREVVIEIPEVRDKVDDKGNVTKVEILVPKKVVMKRLDYGEKVDLEEEALDVRYVGEQPMVKVSAAKLRILSILKSIVKSDITLNSYEAIKRLPQDAGNKLYLTYLELNGVDNKKKE